MMEMGTSLRICVYVDVGLTRKLAKLGSWRSCIAPLDLMFKNYGEFVHLTQLRWHKILGIRNPDKTQNTYKGKYH
ncbi:unnamed protein product [Citrullus colocynthis]|uniref:Uncharacterized protein n=1 Tax=Citrullus colocynthis TaxID=252529 RepID=A0ABP0Z523_9ROSI